MPSMSQIERTFCRSRPWGLFAERAVLPWALQGTKLHGDLLELGAGSGEMAAATLRQFPDIRTAVTDVAPGSPWTRARFRIAWLEPALFIPVPATHL